jgi:transposase
MLKLRVVKTGSSAHAVQAVRYEDNRRHIVKHFGSCKTEKELDDLLENAQEWIRVNSGQIAMFDTRPSSSISDLDNYSFLGVYYTFIYEVFTSLLNQISFLKLNQPLLIDLVIMRLLEPASKLQSIELIESYFGIRHLRKNYYKIAPVWLHLKESVESTVITFAKQHYEFNYDILFYDVTTLYFETFQEDELRRNGFSKDNKSQQPQLVVALMVSKEGFPIAYEIFPGNTFEGHTIIPVINSFIDKHQVKHFTVVADAAMISAVNINELLKNNVHYIVGARLGNLSIDIINLIDKEIFREDGRSIRLKTENGYLICSYSTVRYRKDKYEMEKQIEKAKLIIEKPSKKRKIKFTQTKDERTTLNQALIDKTTKLLGIKGYYTDLEENIASNQQVIERYHELYKIEQAFRISKSDLKTRPIFHFKQEPIKLHMLICFMALVISKHIELKTQTSIKRFLSEFKKITDARMLNNFNGKEKRIRAKINPEIIQLLEKLNVPH